MSGYVGKELELFKHALNRKKYYARFFREFLKGDVLEGGSGIGETTALLCRDKQKSWVFYVPPVFSFLYAGVSSITRCHAVKIPVEQKYNPFTRQPILISFTPASQPLNNYLQYPTANAFIHKGKYP